VPVGRSGSTGGPPHGTIAAVIAIGLLGRPRPHRAGLICFDVKVEDNLDIDADQSRPG
jgi:hypothetical protein